MKKAYCIVQILALTDPDGFQRYVAGHTATLSPYGGRFLVKGMPAEVLEGEWRGSRVVVHEFPDLAHFRAWYDSEAYRPWKQLRQASAEVNVIVVEGVLSADSA